MPPELELELIQSQMAHKPMLRGEVGAHALRVRSVSRCLPGLGEAVGRMAEAINAQSLVLKGPRGPRSVLRVRLAFTQRDVAQHIGVQYRVSVSGHSASIFILHSVHLTNMFTRLIYTPCDSRQFLSSLHLAVEPSKILRVDAGVLFAGLAGQRAPIYLMYTVGKPCSRRWPKHGESPLSASAPGTASVHLLVPSSISYYP